MFSPLEVAKRVFEIMPIFTKRDLNHSLMSLQGADLFRKMLQENLESLRVENE